MTCEPIDRECATWKRGAALNALVSSARRPEKLELFRKTSRWTSRAMFSTVPGLDSPNASLRSWNAEYTSSIRANGPVCAAPGGVIIPLIASCLVGSRFMAPVKDAILNLVLILAAAMVKKRRRGAGVAAGWTGGVRCSVMRWSTTT